MILNTSIYRDTRVERPEALFRRLATLPFFRFCPLKIQIRPRKLRDNNTPEMPIGLYIFERLSTLLSP